MGANRWCGSIPVVLSRTTGAGRERSPRGANFLKFAPNIRCHWACPADQDAIIQPFALAIVLHAAYYYLCLYTPTLSYTSNRIKSVSLPRYQPPLERQPGAEHQGGIEIQLSVQRTHDVRRLAEAVLLTAEQQITDGNALGAQRVHHDLGLAGRHDPVLIALEEDHRPVQPIGVVQRRALAIKRLVARQRR